MENNNVLTELCYNDLTRVYEKSEYGLYPAEKYMIEKTPVKGLFYYSCPYLSFGDYDNSCEVERSNVRVFMERFSGHPDVHHDTGIYGYEAILIDVFCTDKEIIEVLTALENYPAIDDCDVSQMKIDMEGESWENWIKQDFKSAILKKYDLFDLNCSDEILSEYYNRLMEETNTYFEVEAGGVGYIDIERLMTGLPDVCPVELMPEK